MLVTVVAFGINVLASNLKSLNLLNTHNCDRNKIR